MKPKHRVYMWTGIGVLFFVMYCYMLRLAVERSALEQRLRERAVEYSELMLEYKKLDRRFDICLENRQTLCQDLYPGCVK